MSEVLVAYVSHIQHFNVHDGTGLRTTIFFQGCGLRCAWCQNPELLSQEPVMMFQPSICTQCMACVDACPVKALRWVNGHFSYEKTRCIRCGRCEEACYFLARSLSSHRMTVDAVFGESIRDERFYRGGGGITLSGGEPLLHRSFVVALLKRFHEHQTNVTVETAGFVPWENIEAVLPYVDTFFYDLKLCTPHLRKTYLGTSSDRMLENLRRLAGQGAHVVLRIPLIPGINDTKEEFGKLLAFADGLENLHEMHILPFHQLGASKYQMIGQAYSLLHLNPADEDHIVRCVHMARAHGYRISRGGAGFQAEEHSCNAE